MDINDALDAFSALSQRTRLDVLRLLIRSGADGMGAGEIGAELGVRQNTMSQNLAVLLKAGLVRNERQGRAIRYYADLHGLQNLLNFLLADCCGGHPELCRQVIDQITGDGASVDP